MILAASLGQALLPVRRRPDPRPDHLAADPGRRRRRWRGAQRGRRAARRVGARRRGLRLPHRRRHARWCATRRCWPRSTDALPARRRQACCRRSTTSSAPASSRATSSRSRPSGSSRSARPTRACCATPTCARAEASVLKVRGTNGCGRGVEGTGFLYAADRLMTNAHVVAGVDEPEVEVGDDTARRRRSSTTTPTSTSPSSTLRHRRRPALALRRRRPGRRDAGRRARLPAGRPVRRRARPHPLRAAAALARHLRRRHRHPRGLLPARH